jgi:NAD(P)-dependent dehydrogenase (short-subunit alcohol dehydrogenase family)
MILKRTTESKSMNRTVVITGSASGIGKATAERCRAAGHTVIGVDLRDADIETDLGTTAGRARMIEEVGRRAPDGIDAVLAGAGISHADRPRETLAINYFGTVATLEGLRPLLARAPRPRAVAICSTAGFLPGSEETVQACLEQGEETALAAVSAATAYADSKRALSLWLRQTAIRPEWAGAGILLNGVAPGVVETAMTKPLLEQPDMVALIRQSNPIAVDGYAAPEEIAELIGFLLGFQNHYLLGQIIFIDGGSDAILRTAQF